MSSEKKEEQPADSDKTNGWNLGNMFAVNTRMLPCKFAYILYGGNVGSHVAFLNLFFISVGLNTSQAGIITGIRFASAIVATPLWGLLTDYTGRRKVILTILCIGASLPMFSMPWVSRWIYPRSYYASLCGRNSTTTTVGNADISRLPSYGWLQTMAINVPLNASSYVLTKCESERSNDAATLFYVLMAIVTFASAFLVPLPGYVDTIAMRLVKSDKDGASYGGQRIFGSLGFSIANLLAGLASETYKEKDMSNYTVVFYLLLGYTLLLIPVGCYMIGQTNYAVPDKPDEPERCERDTSDGNRDNLTKMICALLFRFDVLFFMATVLFCGLANNLFMNFVYMLVRDDMQKTKTEMTLVVVMASMSELLVFPLTSRLIRLVGGNIRAIMIGMFSYFVRFIIMSYDVPFGVVLSVQPLHSLGFALAFAAMMEHMYELSPAQINVTMNSFMMVLFFSVSNILANLVGAYIYQKHGGRALFFGMAVLCGVWVILMVLYHEGKKIRSRYLHKVHQTVRCKLSSEDCGDHKRSHAIVGGGIENPLSCVEDERDEKDVKISK